MTVEEMRARKRELGYSYEKLSQVSGVPLGTVQKVLGGVTKSPRYDTIRALEQALRTPQELKIRQDGRAADDTDVRMLREPAAGYRAQPAEPANRSGGYTLEDYYALPEDRRAELIDGKLYDMAAPAVTHQILAGRIFSCFLAHVDAGNGQCVPLVSPVDVQLDRDNRTMVQPDVLILCDRTKLRRNVVYGAPDLVVEILSKSTRSKDMIIKLNKYFQAGVREYWIVDPSEKKIQVYLFTGEELSFQMYEGTEEVPVGIWNGACRVDFGAFFSYLDAIGMLPD